MEFLLNNIKIIILIIITIALFALIIKYYKKIKTFLIEVRQELGKVAWSTRQELIGSTFVVIVVTFIIAVFIGGIDLLLSKILSLVFK
jgi:preprotein translocase subunit SecE